MVMSNFPIVRAKSIVCLPSEREVEREGTVGTLTRVTSVPNIASLYVGQYYQPNTLYKYRRDWELLDDYWHDRYNVNSTLHWKDYRFNGRRFMNTDPIPNSLGLGYPSFWSRYKWYSDFLNPQYWRKYRDPYYDRPLWDSWKPYFLDRINQKRAIDLYRKGIINFNYLDKNWITPHELSRKDKDWADIYSPARRYGARRYFYSFAA